MSSSKRFVSGGHQRRTHPLVWCAAIVCTVLSIAVIVGGVVLFIGYLAINPKVPFLSIANAHLDLLRYDLTGLLETQVSILLRAENDNAKAHATFSESKFILSFDTKGIAYLDLGDSFEVNKNSSVDFNFVVHANPIPLKRDEMEEVDQALKKDEITFDLKGSSRAQWKIGLLGSVKFWCRLECKLRFRPSDHSYIYSLCNSKAK